MSASGYFIEFNTNYPIRKGDYDADCARYITNKFCSLPEASKMRLRIALQRLNASFRRQEMTDRAIELGIALEAVLTRDRKAWDPISMLIILRGAWLVGSDADERSRIAASLNKAYVHRSKAVHDGRIELKQETWDDIARAQCVCAAIIATIIERDDKVDWNALLLGGT